jgi:hypothetical protein
VISSSNTTSDNSLSNYGNFKANSISFLAIDNKLKYCQYHGIECFFATSKGAIRSSSERTLKIYWINKLLKAGYQSILLLDLDTFITSITNIHDSVSCSDQFSIAITKDFNKINQYNTGVMKICRDEFSLHFFRKLWKLSQTEITSFAYNSQKDVSKNIVIRKAFESDQYLFNLLLHNISIMTHTTRTLFPKYPMNDNSNTINDNNNNNKPSIVRELDRRIYNAFPVISSQHWYTMKLPIGDEILVDHYASNSHSVLSGIVIILYITIIYVAL